MPPGGERVVLVTGGAGGIGLATARAFFDAGHSIILADIREEVVHVAARSFPDPARAVGVMVDVTAARSIEAGFSEGEEAVGEVDILVNNAAVFAELPFVDWSEIEPEVWDQVMAVNLRGPFLCSRRVLPAMVRRGWGRIINLGSTSSIVGMPLRVHYATSKAGVVGMTRSLARAVGRSGVTVNCVAPGATQSEAVLKNYPRALLDHGVAGRSIPRRELPEDVVGAISFLASDAAEFITGQTLVVDGGHTFL